MVDLSSILSRTAKSIEPPKMLPVGNYIFRVLSWADKKPDGTPMVSANGNPQVIFQVQAETPIDVDSTALQGVTFPVKMRHSFTLTDNEFTQYKFMQFLQSLGLSEELTLAEMLTQSTGQMFQGSVIHQASTKPGDNTLYANVGNTAAVS